jgi:hypothetical protein
MSPAQMEYILAILEKLRYIADRTKQRAQLFGIRDIAVAPRLQLV